MIKVSGASPNTAPHKQQCLRPGLANLGGDSCLAFLPLPGCVNPCTIVTVAEKIGQLGG